MMRFKDKKHLIFIRQLPCVVSGEERTDRDRVAHHLLRTGEHGMGLRSGDNWALPLAVELHDEQFAGSLHNDGNETEWFKRHGILDPMDLAALLYENSGDFEWAWNFINKRLAA